MERKESPKCNCEHASHFPDGPYRSHLYGNAEATHTVITVFGTFEFCAACIAAHSTHTIIKIERK